MQKINSTLDNGLMMAAGPMDHMESVSLGIWLKAGGRYETNATSGISHLVEHLLFKGTTKRDTKKIKEEIEGRGGSFNGFTTEEFTCYLVKLLAKDIELGVDILSDMVLHPRLDDAEIEKEKSIVIEEIHMYQDIPAQHVHEVLSEMLWPDQPLGFPLAGRVESVHSITKRDIISYKEEHYNPRNMLIIGAGKMDEDVFAGLAKKYIGAVMPGTASGFEKARSLQGQPSARIQYKETEQTHVALGLHAHNRFHPDRYASSIMNIILGANMSSRLFHIVRDELALCYEISSSMRRYDDTGAFVIGAGIDEKKLIQALGVILHELEVLKKEPVSDDELKRAKEFYKGQLLFTLEDTMSLMLWLGEKIISGEQEVDIKKIVKKIEEVSQEDLMRVADTIFKNENLNLAVIGPVKDEKKVREVLRLS